MALRIKSSLSKELIRGTGMTLYESITLPERAPVKIIKGDKHKNRVQGSNIIIEKRKQRLKYA